jgi:type 1 glutamine amidotransferase
MSRRISIAILTSFLAFASSSLAEGPKRLLLLGQGSDGHPPQTHEYLPGLKVLEKCLRPVDGLGVTVLRADEPWDKGPELLKSADGVVIFLAEGAQWLQADSKRQEAFSNLAKRGGGLVVLHWGMGTKDAKNIDGFLQLLGGCHGGPDRKFKVLEADAKVVDHKHPISTRLNDFRARDEFYYHLKFSKSKNSIQPILQVPIDGTLETVAWAWERPEGGRSFGFSGLHFHDNWRLPEYRRLVAQAVLWTLKLPIPKEGLAVEVTEEDLKLN